MKASEYAALYKANPTDETIAEIANGFLREIRKTIQAHNVQTDGSVFAVFDELDGKWRAMSRQIDGALVPEGFALMVEKILPPVYRQWQWHKTQMSKLRSER